MSHGTSQFEYVVYTYQNPSKDQAVGAWKRHLCTNDKDQAIKTAQALYGSCDYARVEVKRRPVDSIDGELGNETIKLYGVKKHWFSHMMAKIFFAGLKGMAAVTAGFFAI